MSDQGKLLHKQVATFDRIMLQSAAKTIKSQTLDPYSYETIGPALIISLVKKIGPIIESTIDFLKSRQLVKCY